MLYFTRILTFVILCAASMQTAQANSSIWVDGQDIISSYMRSYGQTTAPSGYISFCRQHANACKRSRRIVKRVRLTPAKWREMQRINRFVNRTIEAVSDKELYGKLEYWTFPVKKGDCEDFVLLKRRLLIRKGWPASTLRITVVRDDIGEGHAVLTVRTSKGDYILDNKRDRIVRWNELPYRYYKWQSQYHPNLWVALMPYSRHRTTTAARGRSR